MKVNINKLRNRAINATVTVLKKAKAPAPVDSLKARLSKLPDHELVILSVFIDSELVIRQNERATAAATTREGDDCMLDIKPCERRATSVDNTCEHRDPFVTFEETDHA